MHALAWVPLVLNPANAAMGSNDWPDWWLGACGFRGNQLEAGQHPVFPQADDELKIHRASAGLQGQQRKPIALQLADHSAGSRSEFKTSRDRQLRSQSTSWCSWAATPSRSGGARCPRVFRIRRSSSVNTLKSTRRRLPHPLGCSTPAGWHRGCVGRPGRAEQSPAHAPSHPPPPS